MSSRCFQTLVAAACLAGLAGCQTPTASQSPPAVKYMDIGGHTRLPWVEQGRGAPVVFVHGAVSDYRTWDRHRAALADSGYRAIAYSQRYFGTEPWGQNWPAFGVQTHSDDLVAFVRGLGVGPVHLVAWSYSGHMVLNVALKHPELVKSAFVFEPAVPSYVSDAAALKAIGDDAGATFAPAVKAMQDGDNAASVRELIDAVGERKGYFEAQPASVKAVQLDSARTMPMLFADKAPPISCVQLGQIKLPVAMVRGADVRPFFKLIADAAAHCMPTAKHLLVPNQKHMWPGEDVTGFNTALVAFLKSQ
jgi:pimeloyl-ACP methyl ester carboxylesterase